MWITGASGGIGEGIALAASRRGARLVLSARRLAELHRVRLRCVHAENVAVLPFDLAEFDAAGVATAAAEFFGPIDVLVNNAGISQRSLVLETDMEVYRRIMQVDFFAAVALIKAVLPEMARRGAGHIATISSVVGKVATPLRSGYAAAKHALHGFHDALRAEVHGQGVKVTVICPGFVHTEVSRNAVTGSGAPHGRMDAGQATGMDPRLCGERIVRAIMSDRSEAYIGGKEIHMIGLKRLAPSLIERIVREAVVA